MTYSGFSKWPELHYNLGLAYLKLGHLQEASDSFTRYLNEAPQATDATAVRDQIARLDVALEKEQRRLKLQGAWNCGGNMFYPAINLYIDGTNITAGVFVQGEAFQGARGLNARWDRVPVTMDRGQLTLRYYTQHKSASPDCGPHNVTFNLTRIAEDKLEGTVSMTYVGSDDRMRMDVTRTYVFERENVQIRLTP